MARGGSANAAGQVAQPKDGAWGAGCLSAGLPAQVAGLRIP